MPPLLSFLLPTRGRSKTLQGLLDSVVATTAFPDQLEIVLVLDRDDTDGPAECDAPYILRRVVVEPGLPMGALNMAAYRASTGRYVMLMNDDIILRTPQWDCLVRDTFAAWGDDVGLVHVNDLLFRETLCTFPLLSRAACEDAGLCPEAYRRYLIDDHISEIYALLEILGYPRRTYLPEVVFEHLNFQADPKATRDRYYSARSDILQQDTALFRGKFEERKEAAIRLACRIDAARGLDHSRAARYREILAPLDRPGSYTSAGGPGATPSGSAADTALSACMAPALPAALGRLFSTVKERGWRDIALYGAGKHTRRLLQGLANAPVPIRIVCIADDWPSAETLNGIPVIRPAQLRNFTFDALIVSSDSMEQELLKKARSWAIPKPIVGLYA